MTSCDCGCVATPLEYRRMLSDMDFYLVDVSDIFYFFCSGEGKGAGRGGEGRFFIENPRRGGGLPGGWRRGGGGGEVPGGCLRGMGGGGLNIFFRGRNSHQVYVA